MNAGGLMPWIKPPFDDDDEPMEFPDGVLYPDRAPISPYFKAREPSAAEVRSRQAGRDSARAVWQTILANLPRLRRWA